MDKKKQSADVPSADIDRLVRSRRIKADAARSMSENLAEGIALSHKPMRFTGVARDLR